MDTSNFRGSSMVRKIGAAIVCGGFLAGAFGEEEGSKVELKPLSVSALQEFGMLKSGRFGANPAFQDEWTDHFGAFVTQSAIVNEHVSFDIGLGGLFQYQKTEVKQAGWGGSQYKNFFVGPTIADIVYRRNPEDGSGFSAQLGLFPYKYNPNAMNLGEYLFRCGPYPSYIFSGTYAMVNSTATYLQGLKTSYKIGNLTGDLLLTTETTLPVLYDWSLGAVLKYRVADGLIDLGAGANYKHMIPVRPSRTTSSSPRNSYFVKNDTTWSGNVTYYQEHATFYNRIQDSARAAQWQDYTNRVTAWIADSVDRPLYQHYTQKGVLLMASLAIDPKKLFSTEVFGEQDLKLYAEAALLGVKNYPIFYEKQAERIPVMAGFNFPGFKILDLIALQVEYFNSPWMNSYGQAIGESGVNAATPSIPSGSDTRSSLTEYNDIAQRDNLAWSVLLKKEVTRGAWLSAQFARDHTRLVSIDTWAGPGVEPREVLDTDKDWYWMLQFSFGI